LMIVPSPAPTHVVPLNEQTTFMLSHGFVTPTIVPKMNGLFCPPARLQLPKPNAVCVQSTVTFVILTDCAAAACTHNASTTTAISTASDLQDFICAPLGRKSRGGKFTTPTGASRI